MTAIVIGGGPAGGLAATLLARAGMAVTVIEQSRFPRDKVCGECLSALGLTVLDRHDLAAPLRALGRLLTNAHLFGRGEGTTLSLPSPMLGLSRAALDAALLDAARTAGARVLQPSRVEAIEPSANDVMVRVRCLITNAVTQESADVALLADGRDALSGRRHPATGDLGIKAHFEGVAADPAAITLYGGIGCYGGVAPVEGDRWNVAFSVPRSVVASTRGDLQSWWERLTTESPVICRHFKAARRTGEWLASPLPRHAPPEDWPARVIPIGAAACAIEPVGGEGMGTALRSAELAANAIVRGRTDGLAAEYRRLWNGRGRFCRLGGWALADEAMSDGAALAGSPVLEWLAMRAIGK